MSWWISFLFCVMKNFKFQKVGRGCKNKSLTPASQFLFFWGIFNWKELVVTLSFHPLFSLKLTGVLVKVWDLALVHSFCLHFLLLSDRLRHLKAQSLSVCYLHDLWILLGKCFNVPRFPKVWSHLGLYSCITSGDFFSFVCLGPSWFMPVVLAYLLIAPWFPP